MPHGGKRSRSGGRRPPATKRTPPPESTGKEAEYLAKTKEDRTPVAVMLLDGQLVEGVIEYYDRAMIKITVDSGPNLFIRKDQIRYLYKTG